MGDGNESTYEDQDENRGLVVLVRVRAMGVRRGGVPATLVHWRGGGPGFAIDEEAAMEFEIEDSNPDGLREWTEWAHAHKDDPVVRRLMDVRPTTLGEVLRRRAVELGRPVTVIRLVRE